MDKANPTSNNQDLDKMENTLPPHILRRLPPGMKIRPTRASPSPSSSSIYHSTPLNKDKSKRNNNRNSSDDTPSQSLHRRKVYNYPTMEINICPAEVPTATSSATPKQNNKRKNCQGKNLLIESYIEGTPRPKLSPRLLVRSNSPAYLPDFSTTSLHPQTPGMERTILAETPITIMEIKDLDKEVLNEIAEAVRECTVIWYELSGEWQKYRIGAVKCLENFIAHKNEAMNSDSAGLGFEAITQAVEVGDQLKEMSLLISELKEYIDKIRNLGVSPTIFTSIIPFAAIPLSDMLSYLDMARSLYRKEYLQKKEACVDLMACCSVTAQGEECRNTLNKVLMVWSNNIHITKKDPTLLTMLKEVGEY